MGKIPDRGNGKLIKLPNGSEVDSSDIGANYIVGQGGNLPVSELVDPTDADKDYRDREIFVQDEPLVQAITNKSSTSEVIDIVLAEISEELSHLKWERKKSALDGKSTINHTIARIASLKQLSEILIKRKESSLNDDFNLKSPKFQKVYEVWMNFFYDSMVKVGIDEKIIDLVFNQMKADMVDWEQTMKS
jgi:hypothetical protein